MQLALAVILALALMAMMPIRPSNVTSHEQMESATDPLLNAWLDSQGQEIGDKCNFTFGP